VCCTLGHHGPYRVSQNYNRQACEDFCGCKFDFVGYLQFLCIGVHHHWKPFRRSIRASYIVHCWKTAAPYVHSQLHNGLNRRWMCSKIRTTSHIAQFMSHSVGRGEEILDTTQPWHSQATYNFKKHSCPTCRGEQSLSKFDTYMRLFNSRFGRASDLNTSLRDALRQRSALKG
jgi:hypothetical protein